VGNGVSASGQAQRVPAHSLVRGNDRLAGFLLELLDDGRGRICVQAITTVSISAPSTS
jgi:hypothetical protein